MQATKFFDSIGFMEKISKLKSGPQRRLYRRLVSNKKRLEKKLHTFPYDTELGLDNAPSYTSLYLKHEKVLAKINVIKHLMPLPMDQKNIKLILYSNGQSVPQGTLDHLILSTI
jgi:hypothetical protein